MPGNTTGFQMTKAKVAITLERSVLDELDELVRRRQFDNRSQAIETAVVEKLERHKRTRLVAALNDLDPLEEKALAEEGLHSELESWPAY